MHATLAPFPTLHVFHTAPHPVDTPQPSRHIFSSGARLSTFAREIAEGGERCEQGV